MWRGVMCPSPIGPKSPGIVARKKKGRTRLQLPAPLHSERFSQSLPHAAIPTTLPTAQSTSLYAGFSRAPSLRPPRSSAPFRAAPAPPPAPAR